MNGNLTQLDLCSGIGGFALAAQWAGFRTIGFAEVNPFCSELLRRHWPSVPNYGDVRAIPCGAIRDVLLLTAGYPCQPFSHAGKRGGAADDRHLWPAVREVIAAIRPSWVLCENVAGHITLGLDEVLSDLENLSYSVQPLVIPACAVGTKHRRDRVWILANSDTSSMRWEGEWSPEIEPWREEQFEGLVQECLRISVPTGKSGGVSHGLSNRSHRLHGLGNAIVPQVAYPILKAIAAIEGSAS